MRMRHDLCHPVVLVCCVVMPDNKRIQGPEDSQSPLLYLKGAEKNAREQRKLLGASGLRCDGRQPDEIRPLYVKTGVNPHATGSAYIELGRTKVLCAIYGPKETPRREEFQPNGRLTCEFKFAPFSCLKRRQHQQDQEEKDFTALIVQALKRAVRLETFPKLQLEINIMVLENGGNALGASLLSASAALASCGVEMLDLPMASSVVQYDSAFLVDPSLEEEESREEVSGVGEGQGGGGGGGGGRRGRVVLVYLPSLDEITSLKQSGLMLPDQLMEAIHLCIESCMRIKELMREVLCSSS